jgi:hypothetical protein
MFHTLEFTRNMFATEGGAGCCHAVAVPEKLELLI